MTTNPYQEKFPKGSRVRIAAREALARFRSDWKLHHPLEVSQLEHAGTVAVVRAVKFYHGGDVLYELEEVPGTWHEVCLAAA